MHKYKKGNIRNNVFIIFVLDQTRKNSMKDYCYQVNLGSRKTYDVVIFLWNLNTVRNVVNGYI